MGHAGCGRHKPSTLQRRYDLVHRDWHAAMQLQDLGLRCPTYTERRRSSTLHFFPSPLSKACVAQHLFACQSMARSTHCAFSVFRFLLTRHDTTRHDSAQTTPSWHHDVIATTGTPSRSPSSWADIHLCIPVKVPAYAPLLAPSVPFSSFKAEKIH